MSGKKCGIASMSGWGGSRLLAGGNLPGKKILFRTAHVLSARARDVEKAIFQLYVYCHLGCHGVGPLPVEFGIPAPRSSVSSTCKNLTVFRVKPFVVFQVFLQKSDQGSAAQGGQTATIQKIILN